DLVSWACRNVALIRSATRGPSVWPSVATEMVLRTRLMVTASRVGSSARAVATERARHGDFSCSDAVFVSGVTLISHSRRYHTSPERRVPWNNSGGAWTFLSCRNVRGRGE